MQRHHAGPLVVERAAAHEVAVLARDLVRLERPARAGRHHVGMADDADLRVRGTGKVGEPDVAFGVVRLEAHALRDAERRVERLLGTGAERCAVGGLVAFQEAGDAHERGDVLHHDVPVVVKVGVYLLGEFLVVHDNLAIRSFGVSLPLSPDRAPRASRSTTCQPFVAMQKTRQS